MSLDTDVNFLAPRKAVKRRVNSIGDLPMEVAGENEGARPSRTSGNTNKRRRTKSESHESSGEMRRIPVPAHRYTPLKNNWDKIVKPIAEYLHLQLRFNLRTRNVEIRTCPQTENIANLQKAADFVKVRWKSCQVVF